MPNPVNTSSWAYADWEEQSTDAAKLTRLILHKTEVRKGMVEAQQGKGRSLRIDPQYLKMLNEEQQRLEHRIAQATAAASRSTSGPVVVRPQF